MARRALGPGPAEHERLDGTLADVHDAHRRRRRPVDRRPGDVDRLGFDALVLQAKIDDTQAKLDRRQDDIRRAAPCCSTAAATARR